MSKRTFLRGVALTVLMTGNLVWAQSTTRPQDRLRGDITESERITLPGNVHPALAQAQSQKSVSANFPMDHMILLLQPDQAQQAALDQLVAQQHDPQSSQYHQFLTPEQYAERFGVSQNDIEKVTGWLQQHGFQVEEVTPNHLSIVFSGDAYAVQNAFNTEVRQYSVNGEIHHANASDPQIPAALAGVVRGIVKLHDFQTRSFSRNLQVVGQATNPLDTVSSSIHYVGPADWAMIYDVRPLYASNLNGTGQSIAVVGRSNVKMSDIQSFRSQFGLPANNPTVTVAQGSDPGFLSNGDSVEATLDVEWAGAIAPNAQVKLIVSSSTATADGVELASLYAVNHNVAPVLSVSYGTCESELGASSGPLGGTELAFYNSLWQQAASQGMSVFVSAGDSGAAGCDNTNATTGTQRAVNGLCSSPYATCVGGTEFKEGSNTSLYWLGGNNAVLGTAQSYIPEVVWNESGTNSGKDLAAGGGGASIAYAKPIWQTGDGVPADSHRDVPDVAVTAASHDGYLIFYNGVLTSIAGTSASAPSFASLFTIINQKYNSVQGNANPVLYPLAAKQAQGGALIFHDVTSGNNTVPGVTGYTAVAGYDLASGLGSVDGSQLVNHWRDLTPSGSFTLSALPISPVVQAGNSLTIGPSIAVTNGFNSPVSFTISGLPSGITSAFSNGTTVTPGSSSTSLQLAVSSSVAPGSYSVTITATGGGISHSTTVAFTVAAAPAQCTFAVSPASVSIGLSQSTNLRLTCTAPVGALPAGLTLAVTGQPAGVTAAFSPTTLKPGTDTTNLTLVTPAAGTAGTYTLAITASGGTFSKTIDVPFTLLVPPSLGLAVSPNAISIVQGTPGTSSISLTNISTFNSATSLFVGGLPTGMTGSFSPATFAAPGAGVSTLTLQPSTLTMPGKYTLTVTATGGGLTRALPIVVTVTAAPNFTLTESNAGYAIQAAQAGGTVSFTTINPIGSFNAPVTMSLSGLPVNGTITGTFSSSTIAAPGIGTSTLALAALSTATPGQYKLTITAAGGSVSHSINLLLTVAGIPGFTLKTNITSLAITAGCAFTTTVSVVGQNGFNSPITLTLGALPAGVTATLSSTTLNSATGITYLTIQTSTTVATGNYSLSVSGTSAAIPTAAPSQTATLAITVGTVATTLSARSVTIKRGSAGTVTVTTVATNFTGTVTFSASGNPAYSSYSFLPNAVNGSGSTTLTIGTLSTLSLGTYSMIIHTGAGGTTTQTPLTLIIN